jgi:tetratricopeptide (TPR) repeat protein
MRFLILFGVLVMAFSSCEQQKKNLTDKEERYITSADSIDIITNLISEDSNDYKLFLKRAYLNLETGKVDPAFRDVNMALEIEPNAPENFLLLSDLYFVLGNIESAVSALRKAAELDPNDEQAYIKLAETYLIIKNYSMAKKSADVALSINQDNEQAYFLKGIAFLEEGDTSNAVTHLRIASNMDTANYRILVQLGSIYQQLNDTVAFDYFNAALRAKPDDEFALFSMARFYQGLGDYETALAYYDKVIGSYPLNKKASYNKGYILLVEYEDFIGATNAFQQALNIDPSYVEAVYNLGRTYEALGLYEEAATKYRQALELHTNYPLAIEGLNRLKQ